MAHHASHNLSRDMTSEPRTPFDVAAEVCLIALLAFGPLAFGAVEPWSQTVTAAFALALAACLGLKRLLYPGTTQVWSWTYVPVLLFVLFCALQLVPLPAGVIERVSPNTLEVRRRLLGDLPEASTVLSQFTLSFYPLATRQTLAVVLTAAVVFFAVVDVYRSPSRIRRLLIAVTTVGGAMAGLALLQNLTAADKIYWSVPTWGRANSGPFFNQNHFAQFMNLSIGAGLALLLVEVQRQSAGGVTDTGGGFRFRNRPDFGRLRWPAVVVAAGLVAVCLSMSRGGMVASAGALMVTVALLARRRRFRAYGWIIGLLVLVAFGGLIYAGVDAVHDRLATLGSSPDPTSGRLQVYKDIVRAWQQFPLVGTGLGTHEVIYPMFDRSTNPSLAEFADSDWFQMAEEVGAIGLVIILSFVFLIGTAFVRAARTSRPSICVAAYGLGFGLIAVVVQSMTDFGQHLPGIAVLTAASCGLLVNLGRLACEERERAAVAEPVPRPLARWWSPLRLTVPAAACAAATTAVVIMNTTRLAAGEWDRADRQVAVLQEANWEAPAEAYAELLVPAEAAVKLQPDNAHYRFWLNWYRWQAISRGPSRLDPGAIGYARRLVTELHRDRALCPTYGPPYGLAGRIELLTLNDPAGAAHVRTGATLAPTDPVACFAAGYVDAREGRWGDSARKFRRALDLDPGMFTDVAEAYLGDLRQPQLALGIAKEKPDWLMHVIPRLGRETPEYGDAMRALKLLLDRSDATPKTCATAAALYLKQKDYKTAGDYLARALKEDYGRVEWRYQLAGALAEQGERDAAIREARICLSLRPQMTQAKLLIEKLERTAPRARASVR